MLQDRPSTRPRQAERAGYPPRPGNVRNPALPPPGARDAGDVEAELFGPPALTPDAITADTSRKHACRSAFNAGLRRPDYPDEVDAFFAAGEAIRLSLPASADVLNTPLGRAVLSALLRTTALLLDEHARAGGET